MKFVAKFEGCQSNLKHFYPTLMDFTQIPKPNFASTRTMLYSSNNLTISLTSEPPPTFKLIEKPTHSDDVREKMKNRYLSNPDYNFEKVNRASMACGPMVKWAIAQVTSSGFFSDFRLKFPPFSRLNTRTC
jgi:hypothetical protein